MAEGAVSFVDQWKQHSISRKISDVAILVGPILVLIGFLFPWATVSAKYGSLPENANPTRGTALIFLFLGLTMLIAATMSQFPKYHRWRFLVGVCALAVIIFALMNLLDVLDQFKKFDPKYVGTLGAGVYLVFTGAGISIIGLLLPPGSDDKQDAAGTEVVTSANAASLGSRAGKAGLLGTTKDPDNVQELERDVKITYELKHESKPLSTPFAPSIFPKLSSLGIKLSSNKNSYGAITDDGEFVVIDNRPVLSLPLKNIEVLQEKDDSGALYLIITAPSREREGVKIVLTYKYADNPEQAIGEDLQALQSAIDSQ